MRRLSRVPLVQNRADFHSCLTKPEQHVQIIQFYQLGRWCFFLTNPWWVEGKERLRDWTLCNKDSTPGKHQRRSAMKRVGPDFADFQSCPPCSVAWSFVGTAGTLGCDKSIVPNSSACLWFEPRNANSFFWECKNQSITAFQTFWVWTHTSNAGFQAVMVLQLSAFLGSAWGGTLVMAQLPNTRQGDLAKVRVGVNCGLPLWSTGNSRTRCMVPTYISPIWRCMSGERMQTQSTCFV